MAGEKLRIWDRQEFFGLFSASITSLSTFPLKFLPSKEADSIQASLTERGLRYFKIKERVVKQYDGLYLYLRRPGWNYYNENANYNGTFLPETTSGRVVIDPKTFNEEARQQKEELAAEYGENEDDNKKDSKLGMPVLIALPCFAFY